MNHSAEINELAAALAKAQGAITTAAKDKTNPFLKSSYADLASVMAAARAHLSANGLAVIQTAETTNAGVSVTTMLAHASGQWISGTMSMEAGEERGKSSAQVLGSIVTYLRRYGYMAITGVVADDDDDGNAATGRPTQTQPAPKAEAPKPAPEPQNGDPAEETFWYTGRTKAIHQWLTDTYGVNIDAVHDQGKKLRDFANRDAFVAWCKATFKPLAQERAEVIELAAEVGGVVAK